MGRSECNKRYISRLTDKQLARKKRMEKKSGKRWYKNNMESRKEYVKKYQSDIREIRKEKGQCLLCGETNPSKFVNCEKCRKRNRELYKSRVE